jgi:hypothetical protein
MLTGRPPFRMQSIADILARDPEIAPPPIAAGLGAPASLDAVLASGLATDRNRRPPTALLLAEGLETIARELVSGPPPPAGATVLTSSPSYPVSAPPISDPPLYSAAYAQAGHPGSAYDDSPSVNTDDPNSVPSSRRRSSSTYVLVAVGAVALFAIAMFVTILLLR